MGDRLTYDAARDRALERAAGEGPEVNPVCHSRLLDHGERTPGALVCLHGYTNCPEQFSQVGRDFFELGFNVYTPRYPHHGLLDRLNREQSHLRAEELIDVAEDALAIGGGLGDRVVVMGLSLGGVLAGWLAQNRDEVDLAVLVSPLFWLRHAPRLLQPAVGAAARALPSAYLWWDRSQRADLKPAYGYPRLATRGFGAMLKVGGAVTAAATTTAPRAGQIVVVTNAADPGVDNGATARLVEAWRRHGATVSTYEFPVELGLPHDLVDPGNRAANVGLVYPVLQELVLDRLGATRP